MCFGEGMDLVGVLEEEDKEEGFLEVEAPVVILDFVRRNTGGFDSFYFILSVVKFQFLHIYCCSSRMKKMFFSYLFVSPIFLVGFVWEGKNTVMRKYHVRA